MAITMSKPPKPLKVKRNASLPRPRTAEERREIQRKVEAIRREAYRKHLELSSHTVDTRVLRSPKVLGGMVLVLLILGVLVVGAFNKKGVVRRIDPTPGRIASVRRSLTAVAQGMTYYRVHTRSWPAQAQGLWALARNPGVANWRGPYINAPFLDPWKQPIVYVMPLSPFEAPELYSCGPDRLPNTADDIRMLPEEFVCNEGSWQRPADEASLSEE